MQQIIIRMQQKSNKTVKFFYYPNTEFSFKFISRFILVFLFYLTLIYVFCTLRRYDTLKTWRWNFFKFSLCIIEIYVKISFKNWELGCHFLSSRGQKIKNITKIEHTRLYLFTFLVEFFIAFLEQKLIYTINI